MALQPFRFGVLADIQNADKDNTYFEGRTRHHREVPLKLRLAVDGLLEANAASAAAPRLSAAVCLGDLVDGYAGAPDDAARSLSDLAAVTAELSRLEAAGVPARHAFGNHDLSVPRAELARALGLPEGSTGYYSAPLAPGWRLVVVDTTEVALYGAPGPSAAAEAREWLGRLEAEGAPNALDWNSGVSAAQLAWLRLELRAARDSGERVVAACHHPLVPGAAPDHYLAWNAAEVAAALEETPGLVALVLSGHFHAGAAAQRNGVHYVTLEGVVEAPPGSTSWAVVTVDEAGGWLRVEAGGYATARELRLAPYAFGRGGAGALEGAAAAKGAAAATEAVAAAADGVAPAS